VSGGVLVHAAILSIVTIRRGRVSTFGLLVRALHARFLQRALSSLFVAAQHLVARVVKRCAASINRAGKRE
jgi:hypothetical protein